MCKIIAMNMKNYLRVFNMDSRIGIQDKIIILSQVGKKLFRGFFKRFY